MASESSVSHLAQSVTPPASRSLSEVRASVSMFDARSGTADAKMSMVPLGRAGTKWECAMGVLYLISKGAGYVTGETLVMDGGVWLAKGRSAPREVVRSYAKQVPLQRSALQ